MNKIIGVLVDPTIAERDIALSNGDPFTVVRHLTRTTCSLEFDLEGREPLLPESIELAKVLVELAVDRYLATRRRVAISVAAVAHYVGLTAIRHVDALQLAQALVQLYVGNSEEAEELEGNWIDEEIDLWRSQQ